MNSKLSYLLMIYIMVAVSLIYIIVNWPYTPMDAIEDSKKLGMWGILIDVLIVFPFVMIFLNRRKARARFKYQRNES